MNLNLLGIGLALIAGLIFVTMLWGKSSQKAKQANRRARDAEEDSKIDADANVDDPIDRM